MTKQNMSMTVKRTVELHYTADDWELYTVSHPVESQAAAWDINRAIEKSVNRGAVREQVRQDLEPVFKRHEDLGARDSEPRNHFESILDYVFGEE